MKEQPKKPASVKPWEPKPFSDEAMRKTLEQQEKRREFLARKNPKGVPMIFPPYD